MATVVAPVGLGLAVLLNLVASVLIDRGSHVTRHAASPCDC
jgi:hypothetical protein